MSGLCQQGGERLGENAEMAGIAKPWVNVTLQGPADGGDFGPLTPGTRTGGIQEALDYANENSRDVFIHGGPGGLHEGDGNPHNIYQLEETLRVAWSQDFTVQGGNYLLSYTASSGSAIHIDSQMNCRYKFGLVSSSSPDPVVCMRPETPGPDDFVVITACVFDFSAVVSGHPRGTSILLDSSLGPIINSRIAAEETNSQGTGLHISDAAGSGQWISNNQIQVVYGNQYHGTGACVGLQLGEPGSSKIVHNSLEMSCHAPRGAHFDEASRRYVTVEDFAPKGAVGASIHAQRNKLTLSCFGKREPGCDLLFGPDSRDNTIFALSLPNGVTNRAAVPSDKIIPNWPIGFDIETPPVPARGDFLVNRTSHAVQVLIVSAGQVTEWSLGDSGSTAQGVPGNLSLVDNLSGTPPELLPPRPPQEQLVGAGLHAGQTFILEPGDRVKFVYTEAPAWRWKALRQ